MEKKPRKNRYHRARKPRPIQVEKGNYIAILTAVAPFHKVRTSQVQRLLPHLSKQNIIRRLADLHSHAYLERTDIEHRNYLEDNEHWINDKGLALLAEHGIFPHEVTHQQPGEQRLLHAHQLMISDLLASLLAGAGERFIPMPEKRLSLPYTIAYTFNGKEQQRTSSLRPDAVLGIRYGEIIKFYLVECENTSPVEPIKGGLSRSSFLRKALAYGDILFKTKAHHEVLGLKKLRILVTALSYKKMLHKMAVVKKLYPDTDAFLFQVVPKNGKVEDLFNTPWFTVSGKFSLATGEMVN